MPTLTVQNAEIKTATVEVKTLAISGKQVTLAVFRQLREEELVTNDGTLNGVPWGIVNYHPSQEKCVWNGWHLHVVWQRGTELRRSTVYGFDPHTEYWSDTGSDFLNFVIRDRLTTGRTSYYGGKPPFHLIAESSILTFQKATEAEFPVAIEIGKAAREVVRAYLGLPDADSPWYKRNYEEFSEKLRWLDEECSQVGDSADSWCAEYRADLELEQQRRSRHVAVRKSLAELPQLFIAV